MWTLICVYVSALNSLEKSTLSFGDAFEMSIDTVLKLQQQSYNIRIVILSVTYMMNRMQSRSVRNDILATENGR